MRGLFGAHRRRIADSFEEAAIWWQDDRARTFGRGHGATQLVLGATAETALVDQLAGVEAALIEALAFERRQAEARVACTESANARATAAHQTVAATEQSDRSVARGHGARDGFDTITSEVRTLLRDP
jgi:hypothetical protein